MRKSKNERKKEREKEKTKQKEKGCNKRAAVVTATDSVCLNLLPEFYFTLTLIDFLRDE